MSEPVRIDLDPADLGRGLADVVVALLDMLREVLERQAIRRFERDELSPDELDRVGSALRDARRQLRALRQTLAEATPRTAEAGMATHARRKDVP
jgi:hypothetical protein